MTIGITGATGQLGKIVVSKLKERMATTDIVALVRSSAKAPDLAVTVREADYDKHETLRSALNGIDTLLLISSNAVGRRAVQHRNVIDAAKQAGIKRVVYTSLLHADSSPLSLAGEHRETELQLQASGLPHTLLRNGWYTENYTASVPNAMRLGAFLGSTDGGKISSAAREDYAEAAVVVLTSQGHDGHTYELAGDEAWTLTDLATEISRQTGKKIPYKDMPELEYASALADFGLPEPLAKAYASFDVCAARGALFDDSRQLSRLIGRATTPLSASIAEALQRSAWKDC